MLTIANMYEYSCVAWEANIHHSQFLFDITTELIFVCGKDIKVASEIKTRMTTRPTRLVRRYGSYRFNNIWSKSVNMPVICSM